QEIDHILRAAIQLGVALLPAKALGLGHGDALEADFVQRFLHLVELERLDDRFDFFHRFTQPAFLIPTSGAAPAAGAVCRVYGGDCETGLARRIAPNSAPHAL